VIAILIIVAWGIMLAQFPTVIVQQSRLQMILTASTPIIVATAAVFQAWLTKELAKRQDAKADVRATKVETVATVAAETAADAKKAAELVSSKVDDVAITAANVAKQAQEAASAALVIADKTHTLVNSQMGKKLMELAIALRERADETGKPEHIKRAEVAEAELAEHELKQHIVDKREENANS
jgi:hypothetical protein